MINTVPIGYTHRLGLHVAVRYRRRRVGNLRFLSPYVAQIIRPVWRELRLAKAHTPLVRFVVYLVRFTSESTTNRTDGI